MSIILSAIKRCLRDKNVIISNVFLVLILPYIFSIIFAFEGGNEVRNLGIIADKNSEITKAYVKVLEDYDKENKKLTMDYDIYEEKQFIDKNSKIDMYIAIDEKSKNIEIEGSKTLSIGEKGIVAVTEEFFDSITLYEEIGMQGKVPNVNNNVVTVTEYKSNPVKTSINTSEDYAQYFAIVMLQMAILALSMCSFKNIFYMKEQIGLRVKSSSVKIFNLVSLELIGSFIVIFSQGILMLGAIYILYGVKINTQNILPILALISVLSILSVCIGVLTTAICKKRISGENVSSMFVTIMVIASGELMPAMNGFVEEIPFLKLNPFIWISREFNSLITLNSCENLYTTLGIGLLASAILMATSVLILKRKVVK